MNPLERLTQQFEKFPGIGARQARRFAYHVLRMQADDANDLSELVVSVRTSVRECESCFRYFTAHRTETICSICSNTNRDHAKLLVVERDTDVQAIEKAGQYDGLYFVLGGLVPLLSAAENSRLRGAKLKELVRFRRTENNLAEVILGFAVNPDGENTARFVESILSEFKDATPPLRISHLGRGLSTGSELEYADPETIKNALQGRG
jgi:recombination protein RecR